MYVNNQLKGLLQLPLVVTACNFADVTYTQSQCQEKVLLSCSDARPLKYDFGLTDNLKISLSATDDVVTVIRMLCSG